MEISAFVHASTEPENITFLGLIFCNMQLSVCMHRKIGLSLWRKDRSWMSEAGKNVWTQERWSKRGMV